MTIRAHLRSLELSDLKDDFPEAARYSVCFVLDSGKVDMLANLTLYNNPSRELHTFEQCTLLAVDTYWKRLEMTRSSYRGVRDVGIYMLSRSYTLLHVQNLKDIE